jgi:hypothetical protein
MRYQDWLEVDPVGVNAVIDTFVGLNPIAIDISGIWLLRTKAAIDIDLLNLGRPKCHDGGAKPFQQPLTPRCETKALLDLIQRCLMISR